MAESNLDGLRCVRLSILLCILCQWPWRLDILAVTKFCSFCVYPQIQTWKNRKFDPEDWGWKSVQYKHLTPIQVNWTSVSTWLCQHPWITCQKICQAHLCPMSHVNISYGPLWGHPCIKETGWQSSMQLCIMPRLLTHLVQESKVGTVDVRMVPMQWKQEIALKEQFVKCHCKTRCVTEH